MGKYQMLLGAAWKRQRFSVCALFLMIAAAALCLFSAVTLYTSGRADVEAQMDRLGFGDFTVWVSGQPERLLAQIEQIDDVERVALQEIIFAGYEVNGMHSDNEGQLIADDGTIPYRFINRNGESMNPSEISVGSIYVSPAMESMFGVHIGDTIQFNLSRTNGRKAFTVAGYFEDAFMGSSMIDMKSFLVNSADYEEMLQTMADAAAIDVLGRSGAMFHISKDPLSTFSDTEFYEELQEHTELARYMDFTYRKDSILNYMLLLQNIVSGFLMIFSMVLFVICLIMIRHSLTLVINQEKGDMAILRTMGLSGSVLRSVYVTLYGGSGLLGRVLGAGFCKKTAERIAQGMVTSTGMLVEVKTPYLLLLGAFAVCMLVLAAVVFTQTGKILHIAPMQTLRETGSAVKVRSPFSRRRLPVHIAVREVLADRNKYMSLCLVAMILTVFLSVIGHMGAWLGPNGEGLMNSFSVAEHDLGIQPLNQRVSMDEIERVINWYSPVVEQYELAMQSVTVNGQEYTANVLDDTKWFHMLSGRVCDDNSILITDTVAREMNLEIGDTVRVSANGRMGEYEVSGIYQCANGMGANIGMSIGGYARIDDITGYIWCRHYILEDGSVRDYVYDYLEEHYRGIDVHTNSWSGLDGIVTVMHGLILGLYVVTAVIILITVALVAGKLLQSEKRNMAIYKSLGLHTGTLRISFALRFLIVVSGGALLGFAAAGVLADPLIGAVFKSFGIGEFQAGFSMLGNMVPLVVIPALFALSAWLYSAKLSRVSIVELIAEDGE
ncbi:MAG: ABC transporter permease [Lachnospiraceae bacterium]|nr:ABC transporter permease [Lachnospiraceae bacterium]